MILTKSDLAALSKIAIKAAQKAGELIQSYAHRDVDVHRKAAADSLASQVLTEVDVKAQNVVLDILAPTLSDYDLALLTEESEDDQSRFLKDYFWCIDPMDGTLAFTEKSPGYAVSIALVAKAGESQLGVVFDPVSQTLYHAVKDQGAYKNKSPWKPDLKDFAYSIFTLYIDRSFEDHKNFASIMNSIEKSVLDSGYSSMQLEKQAGAVLNACWVVDNAPAAYFKIPKVQDGGGSLWDFAATACIINEAGAYGKSMDGSPLDLNRPDSTFMNHKGALFASNDGIAANIRSLLF